MRKSWDNKLRGGKSIRAYHDMFWNNPYQQLIHSLRDGYQHEYGDLYDQKFKRYKWKYCARYHGSETSIYTVMRNAAHRNAPHYSFYGAIDYSIGLGYDFQLWYQVDVSSGRYNLDIRPKFDYRLREKWIIEIPTSTRMTEDAIIQLATKEINRVIMPEGYYRDYQMLYDLTSEQVKLRIRRASLVELIAAEKQNRDVDKFIVRRLIKKQNIYADYLSDTGTLIKLLATYTGKRFKERVGTTTMRDVIASMDYFDGDVDEIESFIHNEFENCIVI